MKTTLRPEDIQAATRNLSDAYPAFASRYPGESAERQPVHTLYGGAHLFRADLAQKMGKKALAQLGTYAPNFVTFARALRLRGSDRLPTTTTDIKTLEDELKRDRVTARHCHPDAGFAYDVHSRVVERLTSEPVEDFRIDFEDGYGHRPDEEEDACALEAADELTRGMEEGTLPRYIGIRIKPFTPELCPRSVRTLDLFVTRVLEQAGHLPPDFVITLPKVVLPEQVSSLVRLCEAIEEKSSLEPGSLKHEIMVETTQSLVDRDGRGMLPQLATAGGDRLVAAHFGVYDYTACCSITAEHQWMHHPACDHARHQMQVALGGTGIWLSDGATNIMPVAPHRAGDTPLDEDRSAENREVIHRAWKTHYDHVRHSLQHAFYQGWDLHPGQLPTRYAALYSFFLEGLSAAAARLSNFIRQAAQATLVGDVFDDAATGQGLLNFFLRGLNCGAITRDEVEATGLTEEELLGRSFLKIVEGRREAAR